MSQVPPPPPKGVKPDIAPLTVLEMARRVDFAADVLLASHRRTEQKAIICAEFGVEGRQADRYLARARKRILAATQKSKDQFFAESVEFYESICRNPVHKTSDRLKARQLLDRATGVGIGAQGAPDADSLAQFNSFYVAHKVLVLQGMASQTGPLLHLQGRSSTTSGRAQAEVDTAWADSTDATRSADLILRAYYTTTAREGIRVRGGSSDVQLGFYGVAPISRAVLATGAGATVDDVITALQNLGLVKQS